MQTIENLSFLNKRVLIRVDYNVPLNKNHLVIDDSRIVASINTIKKVVSSGGKVIIISHLGRPKGCYEERFSLKHLVGNLSKLLGLNVVFCDDCVGEKVRIIISKMNNGDVVLLENLRFYKEETDGCEVFAKKLSELADVYINDAFGTAHRSHASTSIIAKYFGRQKYLGKLFAAEIKNLDSLLSSSLSPFTAIIGGAKISGKIEVIRSLIKKVDNLIIGGGMAYTFIKSLGGKVGESLVENDKLDLASELVKEAKKNDVNLFLPVDSVNADRFNNNAKVYVSEINNIKDGCLGLDIGPRSVTVFSNLILQSKTIIWNGPMGVFEMSNFSKGTREIAKAIASSTKKGAFTLVGGGESVSAIKKFGFNNDVSFLSTGGGAMLRYLEGRGLPGITALEA
jgi:phosphoglycerate kinase